jgi:hypothetical protein
MLRKRKTMAMQRFTAELFKTTEYKNNPIVNQ